MTEPAKGACVPAEAPNPAKGGPPLLIQRVLQLAVAALHTERHHTLAEEVRSVAVTLAAEPAPPAGAAVREAAERLRVSLRIRESRSWCGNRGCDAVRLEAEALLDAIAASPATQERIDHAAEEELERPAAKGGE